MMMMNTIKISIRHFIQRINKTKGEFIACWNKRIKIQANKKIVLVIK